MRTLSRRPGARAGARVQRALAWLVAALSIAALVPSAASARDRARVERPRVERPRPRPHPRPAPYPYWGPYRSPYPYGPWYDPFWYDPYWYDGPPARRPAPWWGASERPSATERGWALLAAGDAKRALAVFAKQARRDADDAQAQLGYAVASAALGDLARAVWAMRHAALADASAFSRAPVDGALRARLSDLARRVHPTDAGEPVDEAEVHFLEAGLHLVAGERAAAADAIAWAIEAGDSAPPALALRDAIRAAEDEAADAPDADAPEPR